MSGSLSAHSGTNNCEVICSEEFPPLNNKREGNCRPDAAAAGGRTMSCLYDHNASRVLGPAARPAG